LRAASGCLCHRLISQPSAAPKRPAALRESDRVQGAPPHGAAGVGRRAGAVRLRLPGPHGAARGREEGSRSLRVHGVGEQGGAREGDGCRVGRADEGSTSREARRGYVFAPAGRGRGVEEAGRGGRLAHLHDPKRLEHELLRREREVESVAYVTRRDVCEFLEEAREPASSRPSKSTSSRTRTRLCSSSSTGPQPAP
jgi:hypothetical protein